MLAVEMSSIVSDKDNEEGRRRLISRRFCPADAQADVVGVRLACVRVGDDAGNVVDCEVDIANVYVKVRSFVSM